VRVFAGIAAAVAVLLVLRRTDGISNPQFWAEDGSVFFQENLTLGCWHALHTFFRGFPYLVQKLVACAATPFPIARVPLVYNVVAYIVTAASIASFSLPAFRQVIRGDLLRVLFCLAIAALPQATELVGNVTNTSWYLGIWLMLLPLMRLPRSLIALGLLGAATLLATFSVPLSVVTAPVWAARALHAARRRRLREACFAGVAVSGVLGLLCYAGSLGRDPGAPQSLALPVLNTAAMHVLADAALGPRAVLDLVGRFGPGVVHAIALSVLIVVAALVWASRGRSVPLLLYCAYGIIAASALALVGHPYLAGMASSMESLVDWSTSFSARYHVLGVSLTYLAVLGSIDRLSGARSHSIATAVSFAWLVSTQAATFILPPFFDLQWPSYADRLERKLAGQNHEPLIIPINPDRLGFAFKIALDLRRMAPEVSIPVDDVVATLVDGTTLEQSFVARYPGLSEIDLVFSTEGHPLAQTVRVEVHEEVSGALVATSELDGSAIASEIEAVADVVAQKVKTGAMSPALAQRVFDATRWRRVLVFPPIPDSEGKRYVITATSSGGAPNGAIGVRGSATDAYADGEARRDGKPIAGDLAFRYGFTDR